MLEIQDSEYSNSYSLHEALMAGAAGSIRGGGAYAFVSVSGIKLYLEDAVFIGLLNEGQFDLVVGVDQITNHHTLERLQSLSDAYDGFATSAYWNAGSYSIFHPKFSWFRRQEGGVLILGSGNLTVNGLRKNTEAFVVVDLDAAGIDQVEAEWNSWVAEIGPSLLPVTDENIVRKAELNQRYSREIRARGGLPEAGAIPEPEQIDGEIEADIDIAPDRDDVDWSFDQESVVLVAEIPKAGNRWNQANFDKTSFEDFFGATAGDNSQRVLLRSISEDASMGEIEIRPSVTVISQNYRFELEAAAGLDYPQNGRPIGVFIKVTTRMFLYVLCMPHDAYYAEVKLYLDGEWTGRADRMKRVRNLAGALQDACPSLPSWQLM